jgi:hypothetical protein
VVRDQVIAYRLVAACGVQVRERVLDVNRPPSPGGVLPQPVVEPQ